MKRLCAVGYRHIGPDDYMTPLMYLPMQRTHINVEHPFTEDEARGAIMDAIGMGSGWEPCDVKDIECHELPEHLQTKPEAP